jgi:hypothetical protein
MTDGRNLRTAFLKWTDPRVRPAWKSMETGDMSPFLHYDYLDYVYRYTRRVKPLYRPRVACVLDGDEIVMMVALRGSFDHRYWKMLGDIQGCGRTDALWKPSLGIEERERLTSFFFRSIPKKMALYRIQCDSPLLRYIPKERVDRCLEQACVSISVPRGGAETLLKSLRPSVRQNIRTAYNRMKRDGLSYRLEVYDAAHPVSDAVWDRIMDLYFERMSTKYKRRKTRSWLSRQLMRRRYYRIKHDTRSLHSLPNGFHAVLWSGKRIMAFMSGLTSHDASLVSVPRLAIDSFYGFYSPGYVLIAETIRYFSAHPTLRVLDLSRGEEKYKLDMGGQVYSTCDIELRAFRQDA